MTSLMPKQLPKLYRDRQCALCQSKVRSSFTCKRFTASVIVSLAGALELSINCALYCWSEVQRFEKAAPIYAERCRRFWKTPSRISPPECDVYYKIFGRNGKGWKSRFRH